MVNKSTNRALSPVPGFGLAGYADQVSVAPGEAIQFMLSGPSEKADVKLVRLIHGDPNPAGPGYKDEVQHWGQPNSIALTEQPLHCGSYIKIPHGDSLNPAGSFTLGLWCQPSIMNSQGWQVLAGKWTPGELSYAIFIAGWHVLTAAISHDGRHVEWCTAHETVWVGSWQYVVFVYDAESGKADLYQRFTTRHKRWMRNDGLARSQQQLSPGPIHRGSAPLFFGAIPRPDGVDGMWGHFNGKIGHPVLIGAALDESAIRALVRGTDPIDLAPTLGHWDLSKEVASDHVMEVSGRDLHGQAVNMPGRAVTGPTYADRAPYYGEASYTEYPSAYNAISLHDDDIDDAHWKSALAVTVPKQARSGIYALRINSEADEIFMPFIVRRDDRREAIGFLVPTLTWLAYSTNDLPFSWTEDGVLDRGRCIYDKHSDGSQVYYCSRLRPSRCYNPMRSFYHFGAHKITSNLYMSDWLETKGFAYQVFADQDLHERGLALLAQHRCIILGSHPEYWTSAMLDALAIYLKGGGRVMYLGGNGLYWVTSIDPKRPHIIEVRKPQQGPPPAVRREPGEALHSTTNEVGGFWADRARAPRNIVGVEYTANVWVPGEGRFGFRRTTDSYHEKYAFVFEGVGDEIIGNFGLNLGSAAANEMDSAVLPRQQGVLPRTVVLARASHALYFGESAHPPVAHIAVSHFPNGGMVFAAGSVTWTGSLSHDGYKNNVSRITENVLRQFIEGDPVMTKSA